MLQALHQACSWIVLVSATRQWSRCCHSCCDAHTELHARKHDQQWKEAAVRVSRQQNKIPNIHRLLTHWNRAILCHVSGNRKMTMTELDVKIEGYFFLSRGHDVPFQLLVHTQTRQIKKKNYHNTQWLRRNRR